jgi:hypothetical protein
MLLSGFEQNHLQMIKQLKGVPGVVRLIANDCH